VPVTFADVAKSEYILLTTFTKDGRPKPTAIWAAPAGDGLVAITQEKSWKVKRIRNTPRVTIAPCDRTGNPKGDAVDATPRSWTSPPTARRTTRSANGTGCSARRSTSSPSCAAA
jgi:uncharacterized protein